MDIVMDIVGKHGIAPLDHFREPMKFVQHECIISNQRYIQLPLGCRNRIMFGSDVGMDISMGGIVSVELCEDVEGAGVCVVCGGVLLAGEEVVAFFFEGVGLG